MQHARDDYNKRIQDSANLISPDEPVFLLRAQDVTAAAVVRYWANLQPNGKQKDMALAHAELMEAWPIKKLADLPDDAL